VGIEVELKQQEYGAYMATTFAGKYEGMAIGPIAIAWEPDSALYGMYVPDHSRNSSHVNDPKLLAMLQEQRRIQDRETRKQRIFDIQRYIAEQQYYVFTISLTSTYTWQPYVKNYAPNLSFDYGARVAALWLDK
jgi:ABC-type transport system substrate-binding protein